MNIKIIRYGAALAFSAASGLAADPFVASSTTTDALPPIVISSGSGDFFDFIDSLLNARGPFQSLTGRPYSGNMTFLGVPNAIRFTSNAAGTAVNIALTPTGFNRTFTGASRQQVDDIVEQFFKSEGGPLMADFLKAIARTSPIAVTDGNPTSATALAAASSFSSQGFTSADEFGDVFDTSGTGGGQSKFGGISLGINGGKFEAGVFEGKFYDLSGTILNFGGNMVRLVVPINANYLELDGGSKVGGAGISFCLPIRYKKMSKDSNLNWRITPLFGFSVRGSLDLASLSPLWNAGIVNTVDYRATPKLVVSMVNQFTMHKSIRVKYSDLDFDPDINQQILKNGIRVTTPLSRRVIGDCFVVDTRFLKDAAVDQFWTLGASLAFRATQRWNLVLGFNYDTGDNFKSYSGGISSAWKW